MKGFSVLKELFKSIIGTNLVSNLYHSAKLQRLNDGSFKVVAPVNNRFEYVGLEDTKGFSCYCRQTGPLEVENNEKIGSEWNKRYKVRIPHKLVFFNDKEDRDHEQISGQLVKALIGTDFVSLVRVHSNTEQILAQEAPGGKFSFNEQTFYFAIDFFVVLNLQEDNCEVEFNCNGVENPFCGKQ